MVVGGMGCKAASDYSQKSKGVEADLQLHKLTRSAKTAAVTNGEYPVGTAPLTPATACCKEQGGRCKPNAAAWSTPVWTALDFEVSDPHYFQYTYTSDGKSFTATAVGDLDCDGTTITYTLKGTLEAGAPTVSAVERPTNDD